MTIKLAPYQPNIAQNLPQWCHKQQIKTGKISWTYQWLVMFCQCSIFEWCSSLLSNFQWCMHSNIELLRLMNRYSFCATPSFENNISLVKILLKSLHWQWMLTQLHLLLITHAVKFLNSCAVITSIVSACCFRAEVEFQYYKAMTKVVARATKTTRTAHGWVYPHRQ